MKVPARMVAILLGLSALNAQASEPSALVAYVYESFLNPGLRARIGDEVRKSTGLGVEWVVAGDAGQVVARHQLDLRRKKARAQVLIGIDAATFGAVAQDALSISEKEVPGISFLRPELKKESRFVPLNFGVQAFMVDSERLPEALWPGSWDDLLRPELQGKILLEDPRTSTPGLGFLIASRTVWGENFAEKWKRLRKQWLTLAPGWTQAYGLFQRGEAPLVWSYTTSQAYHQLSSRPSGRYRALVFREGNPIQIEGLIVSMQATQEESRRRAALALVDLLLSEHIQSEIPRAQWMNPARRKVQVPWGKVSPRIPEPLRSLELPWGGESRSILNSWSEAIR